MSVSQMSRLGLAGLIATLLMVIGVAHYHSGTTIKALKASVEILTPAQIGLHRVNGLISASSNALYRFEKRDPINAPQILLGLDRLVELERIAFADDPKSREGSVGADLKASRLRAIFLSYVEEERRDPADDVTAQLKKELFLTLESLVQRVRAVKPAPGADGREVRSWRIFDNLITSTENLLLRYIKRDRVSLETALRPVTAALLVIDALPLESFQKIQIHRHEHVEDLHLTDIKSARDALKSYRIALFAIQDTDEFGMTGTSYNEALRVTRAALSKARNKTSLASTNMSQHFQFVQRSAAAAAERGQRLFLALALFGFIVSLSIAYWLRKSMSRIVGTLLDGADRISAGEFDVRIEIRGSDEFGRLAKQFNRMARNLRQKDDDLYRYIADLNETKDRLDTVNKALEDRVEQRTAELKKREVALANSESRFRDFAGAASDWYWEMDSELRFSYYSNRFEEVTGIDPATLLGKTREENAIPNVDKRQWWRHIDDLQNHRPFRNFIHPRVKDGKTIWLSISGVPYTDDSGNFGGYRGSGNDITDLVEAEMEADAARAEAESANRAKSRFLATMSHEIRTPMHAVLGISDLLMQTDQTPEQTQLTKTLSDSGATLLKIIDDILDLSKIEADRMVLDATDFDLWQNLESVLDLFVETASKKGLLLERDLAANLPRHLIGDGNRLRQILLNLLSNAIKFTERGKVVLRASVQEETPGGYVLHFAVTDTGIGLNDDQQERIFDAFAQADESTTRHYGGTGLGLAICSQLVELMGGRINIESEPDKGATFAFTVKFAKPADVTVPASAAPETTPVLIYCADQPDRDRLRDHLIAWGFIPDAAGDTIRGAELMRLAAAGGVSYKVAIVDIDSTAEADDTDWPALCDSPGFDTLPLILIGSAPAAQPHFDGLKVVAHVAKPVRWSQLHDALTKAGAWESPETTSKIDQSGRTGEANTASRFTAKILVAEDNPVNQDLARRILEHLGCTVDIASDGAEAIRALENTRYDIVFMDCHMPKLDGFEATERIRAAEWEDQNKPPLPVIAVTASAMKEDHDRCLAVGMNAWITKPFTIDQIRDALRRWAPHRERVGPPRQVQAADGKPQDVNAGAAAQASPLDQAALDIIRMVETPENPNFLETIIAEYLTSAEQLLGSLGEALLQDDATALRAAAHSLKSSSANVGAAGLSDMCRVLEEIALADDLALARTMEDAVAKEFASVRAALKAEVDGHIAKKARTA